MNWKRYWKRSLIIILICSLFAGVVVYAIQNQPVKIRNVGTVKITSIGVEVYQDESLTTILGEIVWGGLIPGETKSFNAWIKNTGIDQQKFIMWTENWVPVNTNKSITLVWNYNDSWISPDVSIPVTFTISVDSNIADITNFSFDIWVRGVN